MLLTLLLTVTLLLFALPMTLIPLIRRGGRRRVTPATVGRSLIALYVFALACPLVLIPLGFVLSGGFRRTERGGQRLRRMMWRTARLVVRFLPGVSYSESNTSGERFDRPAVVICNHQSVLDLMYIIALTPQMVILTKDWVWRNAMFGFLVRRAEYLPVSAGMETNLPRLRRLVAEGCSVMVFPEGTRSADGRIHRFHLGAFSMARELDIDLLPLHLHGTGRALPKTDFMLYPEDVHLDILPRRTPPDDDEAVHRMRHELNREYRERAGEIPPQADTPTAPDRARRVVIIGSGLGGLSLARLLVDEGMNVTVLEQQQRIGGCLQTFRRDGAVFETGMHFIGSAAPGELLERLFTRLGITDEVPLSRLDVEGYDLVSLDGIGDFRLASGHEAFVNTLAADFPREREALERYVALTGSIAAESTVEAVSGRSGTPTTMMRYAAESMDTVIDATFTDPVLRQIIAGTLPLIAARRGVTPFTLHAFIMEFYNRSAFRIVGGSHRIADSLARGIRAAGGRILTARRVTDILTDADGVTGVRTADGETYAADIVVSDAHPAVTLSLLPPGTLRPAFSRRIAALPQTASCFTLYLKFRPERIPYMNRNEYCYERGTPWDCEDYTADDWPRGYLYMHFCHDTAPRYAESAVVISYMRPDEVAPWRGTQPGRRGEAYETMKRERAERLLYVLEKKHPGLRAAVESFYTSTPLTYESYNGTPGGAMYGTAADVRSGAAGRVPIRWRAAGLYQTGQCVNSHGILGTLVGTMLTREEIIRRERKNEQG